MSKSAIWAFFQLPFCLKETDSQSKGQAQEFVSWTLVYGLETSLMDSGYSENLR